MLYSAIEFAKLQADRILLHSLHQTVAKDLKRKESNCKIPTLDAPVAPMVNTIAAVTTTHVRSPVVPWSCVAGMIAGVVYSTVRGVWLCGKY